MQTSPGTAMNELSASSPLERLREWDERRPSFPGEHWLAAAAGVYLLLRPRRSVAGRLVSAVGGAMLIARALSGRDGPIAALNALPDAESEASRYVEIAAPWPYSRRVRISTPRRTRLGIDATPDIRAGAAVTDPGRSS